MSTQRVRVWVVVPTIGGAAHEQKDFHPNAFLYRLACVSVFTETYCAILFIFSRLLRPPSVLRDIRKGEPRHWRYTKCAFLPEPAQQMYYTADNNEMQVFPRLTCVNSNTQLTSHPIHAIKILTFIQNASSTPGCRVSGIRLHSVRAARRQRGEVLCLFCYSGLKQTIPL